jgi:raffinose/stachyose/melibiose transport system substrate-binding protein
MKSKLLLLGVVILLLAPITGLGAQEKLSGKVVVYHYLVNGIHASVIEDIQKDFQKIYPDVSFENNGVQQTNYFSTIRQLVAAGETPDMFMGQPSQYPDIIKTGVVKDLSNNVFLKGLGLSKGDINDSSYNGTLYAFPLDFKSYGIFFNKDIFAKLKLKIPTTHGELIAAAKIIKANGIDPFIRCYNDQVFPDIEIRAYFWPALIKAGKTDAWTQLMSGAKKFADYPEWSKALELWTTRMQFSRIDDMGNDQNKALDAFASGKGAMMYQGTWCIAGLKERSPKFDIGLFAIPTDVGPGSYCLQVDSIWMVNGTTPGGKAAEKFLEYWMSPPVAAKWTERVSQPSLTPGVDVSQLPDYLQAVIKAKAANQVAHAGEWKGQIYGEFVVAYRMLLQEYAADQLSTKKLTPKTFTEKLQKEWDRIVATTKK